jgi:hypothetical protein
MESNAKYVFVASLACKRRPRTTPFPLDDPTMPLNRFPAHLTARICKTLPGCETIQGLYIPIDIDLTEEAA